MSETGSVLVVGTYPPVPRPAAAVTSATVRALWSVGHEVTVVSPRLSAAHLSSPVHGILAGRRLRHCRRTSGATTLVLIAEPGMPIPSTGRALPLRQLAVVLLLARVIPEFRQRRVIIVGDLALGPATRRHWTRLFDSVDFRPPLGDPLVSLLGPREGSIRSQLTSRGRRLAIRLLGRHAKPVKRRWDRTIADLAALRRRRRRR